MNGLARGCGTIFKKGNGYCWQRTVDGKKKTLSIKDAHGKAVTSIVTARAIVADLWRHEQEATAEANSLRSRVEVVTKIATLKGLLTQNDLALADLADAWRNSMKRKQGNDKAKDCAIRHFVAWVVSKYPQTAKVSEITPMMAQSYLADYWLEGVTPRAWNLRVTLLSLIFRVLIGGDNPFIGIVKKTEQPESREAFSMAQLQDIWRKLADDSYYMLHKSEMRCLYVLALHSGLRCGDCCLLKWTSVDLDSGIVTVTPRKTSHSSNKKIVIPISSPLRDALLSMLPLRDSADDYVFPKVAQRYQHNPGGISKDTTALLEACGIQTKEAKGEHRARSIVRYGFHSFRHTTATMMINGGVNPIVIKELLGHTTVAMTAHYSHVSIETKRKALSAMSALTEKEQSIKLMISDLQSDKIAKLTAWLNNTLTDAQKHALQAVLA